MKNIMITIGLVLSASLLIAYLFLLLNLLPVLVVSSFLYLLVLGGLGALLLGLFIYFWRQWRRLKNSH